MKKKIEFILARKKLIEILNSLEQLSKITTESEKVITWNKLIGLITGYGITKNLN